MTGQKRDEIRIRPVREDERDEAGEIAVQAFSRLRGLLTPDGWTALEKGIRFVTTQETLGTLLAAEIEGKIAGSVRYTGPGHGGHIIYPDRFAYIRAVAVSPHHLRRGVGQALTQACIAAARRDRAEAVGLHVAAANEAAKALYRQLGFRWYREAPDYFGIAYEAYYIPFPPLELRDEIPNE